MAVVVEREVGDPDVFDLRVLEDLPDGSSKDSVDQRLHDLCREEEVDHHHARAEAVELVNVGKGRGDVGKGWQQVPCVTVDGRGRLVEGSLPEMGERKVGTAAGTGADAGRDGSGYGYGSGSGE